MKKLLFFALTALFLVSCKKQTYLEEEFSKEKIDFIQNYLSSEKFKKLDDKKSKTIGEYLNKNIGVNLATPSAIVPFPDIQIYKEGDLVFSSKEGSILIFDKNKELVYFDSKIYKKLENNNMLDELIKSKILGDYKLHGDLKQDRVKVLLPNIDNISNYSNAAFVSYSDTSIKRIIKIREFELENQEVEVIKSIEELKGSNSYLYNDKEPTRIELPICNFAVLADIENQTITYVGGGTKEDTLTEDGRNLKAYILEYEENYKDESTGKKEKNKTKILVSTNTLEEIGICSLSSFIREE